MFYEITKRIIDIFGAIFGIIIFSPIMLVTAIYIKAVSPEGSFLVEKEACTRSGKNGKPFFMFKFRSMYVGAHEKMLADPVLSKIYKDNNYKIDPDPRLIPHAKFYRKSSIDEMPQFFNVLLGEMSLVGPRAYFPAELIEQGDRYPQTKPYIEEIKKIKPGITGPWQINGRSEIGFVDRVKMDAEYAKRRSIVYDLLIIIKTPFVAFIKTTGAF